MRFNLVFEGGGAKGIVFAGALEEYERRGHEYGRLLGTSAGAITATLLAAGYRAGEIQPVLNERQADGSPRFASFMDTPAKASFPPDVVQASIVARLLEQIDIPFVADEPIDRFLMNRLLDQPEYRRLLSLTELGGLYEGRKFLEWLREKLSAKDPRFGSATLAEFHTLTGRDLTVVAADTTGNQMLVLNHRSAPDCPVAWAVRMSMSVPFLWQEVRWDESWGEYRGETIAGHAIVDGGVLSNFPVHLFTSREAEVVALMGEPDDTPALGLLIDESLSVIPPEEADFGVIDWLKSRIAQIDFKELGTVQRISALVDTMTQAHDRLVIEAYADRVCRLPAEGYGTTEFDMTEERRSLLIAAGRRAMRQFFQKNPAV